MENYNDDVLASSLPGSSREGESARQSEDMPPPHATVLQQLPVNTVVTLRLTGILPEAQENAGRGTVLSGDGPWWMCQIVPPIAVCDHCRSTRPEGYFKGSSGEMEVAVAIALIRWWRYHRIAETSTVELTPSDEAKP